MAAGCAHLDTSEVDIIGTGLPREVRRGNGSDDGAGSSVTEGENVRHVRRFAALVSLGLVSERSTAATDRPAP